MTVAILLNKHQRIWRAVINQALDDATAYIGTSHRSSRRVDRDRAREWLLKPNADFEAVCHLANLEPNAIREGARKLIVEADAKHAKRHAAPGVGPNSPRRQGTGGGPDTQDAA